MARFQPQWQVIETSAVWQDEIRPLLEQELQDALQGLLAEDLDNFQLAELRGRARCLQQLLNTPAHVRLMAEQLLENQKAAGLKESESDGRPVSGRSRFKRILGGRRARG